MHCAVALLPTTLSALHAGMYALCGVAIALLPALVLFLRRQAGPTKRFSGVISSSFTSPSTTAPKALRYDSLIWAAVSSGT